MTGIGSSCLSDSARVTLSASRHQDFNELLCSAIDETIVEVLGQKVLTALHTVLEQKYSVPRDKLPYRTETVSQVLEITLGVHGAKTVGSHIAERFYRKLGLAFHSQEGYALLDYVELAKTKINREPAP